MKKTNQTYTFNKTETRKMISAYTKNRRSLLWIANHFGVSVPTIRRVLTENGVTIRPRGRMAETAS